MVFRSSDMKKIVNQAVMLILTASILLSFAGCSSKSSTTIINANTDQGSKSYIENEDFQYYLDSFSSFIKAEKGYYFITDSKLFFLDTKSKQAYPVCNKINCAHDDSNCMAYLSPLSFFHGMNVTYYDNAIYLLGYEKDGETLIHNYMYQISLDDYKHRKAAYLFDSSIGALSVLYMVHRGYVYYTYDGGNMKETTATLYRVKLGNTEQGSSEKVFEYSGIGANVFSLKAYGNYLFFKTASYENEQGNGYKTVLNCVNIHSLEKRQLTGDIYTYLAEGGKVYYEPDEKTVMCLDFETGEETLFCNIEGPCYLFADSNYIYLDNRQGMGINDSIFERRIYVYDKKGNYVTEIIPKNPYDECYFGGDDLMIFEEITQTGVAFAKNGAEGFYVLDKSTLPASYEFTYIESR